MCPAKGKDAGLTTSNRCQLIIQRRPKRTKPATEAQKEREKRLLKNMRSAK